MDYTNHTRITTEEELRKVIKTPVKAIAEKATDVVDPVTRQFIEASPFFLVATTCPDGSMDVSPRGDPPGSVLIVDDGHALVFADRQGNRRLDSLSNMLRHPHIGMLFLVPGRNDTVRVNGRATIVRDGPFLDQLTARDKRPALAIVVEIDELYAHCAKAFLRSSLWQTQTWGDPADLPSPGQIAKGQSGSKLPASALDAGLRLDERFRT